MLWVPETDRFSGYGDAPFSQEIFYEWSGTPAVAEVAAIVQPNGVTDYVRRESVAFVCAHSPILPISGS